MVSKYRNNECCRLVKEYESMVQGELFDDKDRRGNAGAYLESEEYPEKLLRRWVTGDELESIRKDIHDRKCKELLAQCYWDDNIHFDEIAKEFCGYSFADAESFSERFEYLEKDVDYSEFYSVTEIVDFLKADGGGRMLILSSLGDYELEGVVDTAFSMLSDEELENAVDIFCSDRLSIPKLLLMLKGVKEDGYRYVALYGIGRLYGLSRYGELILNYIEELGLVVVAYGGSSYAISVAVKETLGDRVKVMYNPFRYLWHFRNKYGTDEIERYDLYLYMPQSAEVDFDDWIAAVAGDMYLGWNSTRHPGYRRIDDGIKLESQIKSVLWNCSMDYIVSCLWDEIDYGERFWYKIPNRSVRRNAIDAIAELKRYDPYLYMNKDERKMIRDVLVEMGILYRVYSPDIFYITPIPWLMGKYNCEFENVFERVFMEDGDWRPITARRKSLGFAYNFCSRYMDDLNNLEKADDTVLGRKLEWIYEEDCKERKEMEKALELKCVERHGWSTLGLERP